MKRNLATMLYSCSTDRVDSQDGCLVVQNSITRALVGANEPVLYLISSQIVKAAIADADLQTKHSEPKMLGMQTIYWLSGLLTIKKPSLQRLAFVFAGFGPYSTPIHVPCTDPFSGSSPEVRTWLRAAATQGFRAASTAAAHGHAGQPRERPASLHLKLISRTQGSVENGLQLMNLWWTLWLTCRLASCTKAFLRVFYALRLENIRLLGCPKHYYLPKYAYAADLANYLMWDR